MPPIIDTELNQAARNWLPRLCAAVPVAGALYYALGILLPRAEDGVGIDAFDIYNQFYPNILYAIGSLREGNGLLWNPYQNCGQPFFGDSQTGLLYPVNLLFLFLDREPALLASVVVNMAIGGIGTFLLCRELRLGMTAAVAGALAFQWSASGLHLASWSPTHIAPYAWMPVAILAAERVLRTPSVRRGVLLGVALSIGLLPGFPQIVVFSYQVIVLRVIWALAIRECTVPRRVIGVIALGLILPFFINAIQLLPAAEMAFESVRTTGVPSEEMLASIGWSQFSNFSLRGSFPVYVLWIAPFMLGGAALVRSDLGKSAAFYLFIALIYFALGFGPGTPVFDAYAKLPLGDMFRGPPRFLFVTSLAMALLTALGVEAMARARGATTGRRLTTLSVSLLAAGAFILLFPVLFTVQGWWLGASIAIAFLVTAVVPSASRGVSILVVLAIAIYLASHGSQPLQNLRGGDLYDGNADAFRFIQSRMTAQDRIFIAGKHRDLSLMAKSASIFRVPTVFDYQPQTSRTYAEYFMKMLRGGELRRSDAIMYAGARGWFLEGRFFKRPLFDLIAARYVVIDRESDNVRRVFKKGLDLIWENERVRVYENTQALPRASFIPRIVRVEGNRLLATLASEPHKLAHRILVSSIGPTGFTGQAEPANGSAEILISDPERIVVRVSTSGRGFLFLSDQYYPGWEATVNGERVDIFIADHAFRAVEIPRGDSEVIFVYRPRAFYLGAMVSFVTVAAILIFLVATTFAIGRQQH